MSTFDIPYLQSENSFHTLDIYCKKKGNDLQPVVVFVHGGGWKDLCKRGPIGGHQQWGKALSTIGTVAVIPGYRKSPKVLYPLLILFLTIILVLGIAIGKYAALFTFLLFLSLCVIIELFLSLTYRKTPIDSVAAAWTNVCKLVQGKKTIQHPSHCTDVAAALDWTQKNIQKYGGDPNRIILAGHSAGAHIVAALALKSDFLQDFNRSALLGICLISGPYTAKRMAKSLFLRTMYLHPVFGDDVSSWKNAFPTDIAEEPRVNQLELPPILMVNAAVDYGLEKHTHDLHRELTAAGKHVIVKKIPGTTHASIATDINILGTKSNSLFLPLLASFIKQCVKGGKKLSSKPPFTH